MKISYEFPLRTTVQRIWTHTAIVEIWTPLIEMYRGMLGNSLSPDKFDLMEQLQGIEKAVHTIRFHKNPKLTITIESEGQDQ